MNKASFYEREAAGEGRVRCLLCPNGCRIEPGAYGRCRVRRNDAGVLVAAAYGRIAAAHLDPVEKKPLYHFYPGRQILSVGTTGCNLGCQFCQNWELSQAGIGDVPSELVTPEAALHMARDAGSIGIAYTYNEPLINYEWVRDTAALAHEQGLANVLVTNGYINPEPWRELLPLIDAANIDVKAFDDVFYRQCCGGRLAPVLETVEMMAQRKKHVEVTMLLVPGLNDGEREIDALAGWLAGINPAIPLHISHYFPQYRMERPATDTKVLMHACAVAAGKLQHVYMGNVTTQEYSATTCPGCGATLIERDGYRVRIAGLNGDTCARCGRHINVVQG
jgi:pyruvate formate lyase activating enzyme